MKKALSLSLLLALFGCTSESEPEQIVEAATPEEAVTAEPMATVQTPVSLADVLDNQSDETKARFQYRNPKDTLEFFGVEPGMTVVEALPGGGWYTKILLPYLGSEGHLIGADYPQELWPNFSFMTPERIEQKKTWPETWTAGVEEWRQEQDASVSGFQMTTLPAEWEGTADVVLYIRALHNLTRFESQGGFLTSSLAEAFRALKPGGVVGVVQHHARESMPDEWADGNAGYLKASFVISQFEAAGFQFVGSSTVNSNSADQPSAEDVVWRLPPSLGTSGEDEALAEAMRAIGESNRMTLKFRKPAE